MDGRSSRGEASSPLATVADIQRRLLRPTSTISSLDGVVGVGTEVSFPLTVTSTAFGKKGETRSRDSTKKRKLDDYLDPVLLESICARIDTAKKLPKKRIEDFHFQWPVDDLKALIMENPKKEKEEEESMSKESVDLNEDSETTVNAGGDAGEVQEGDGFRSPFRRFDEAAFKRFKR